MAGRRTKQTTYALPGKAGTGKAVRAQHLSLLLRLVASPPRAGSPGSGSGAAGVRSTAPRSGRLPFSAPGGRDDVRLVLATHRPRLLPRARARTPTAAVAGRL